MTDTKNQLTLILIASFIVFALNPGLPTLGGLGVTSALLGLKIFVEKSREDRLQAVRLELLSQIDHLKDRLDAFLLGGKR
ncbi:MAG: hypothetical protein H0U76_16125 [Ktedonobacteraceae bacterium]|nr:hypothetical protein [Ktedonobacteraceae bacterium]